MPDGAHLWRSSTITVSTVTGDTFVQPVPFIATDNVVMCLPRPEYQGFTPASLAFAAQMLHNVRWRYSYGRQCYMTKFAKTQFLMPVIDDGDLDYHYMENALYQTPYWSILASVMGGR
jgi:type I restriction enzyme M protein